MFYAFVIAYLANCIIIDNKKFLQQNTNFFIILLRSIQTNYLSFVH